MDTTGKRVGRLLIVITGTVLAALLGWALFVQGPGGSLAALLGILITIGVAIGGARFASNLAENYLAPYNVAEVAVEGPIRRQAGSRVPTSPAATPADAIVDQIEAADADDNTEGLIVRLNTPGGEVLPSEDIRRAVDSFEGPTIAYATDTCASGGYWIAAGCDRIVAREGSIVGSIGVLASRVTAPELLDTVGLTYERLVAGEYKDAGVPLREMEESERTYLQGIVDDFYEAFLERVTEGRDVDEATVRETEARVYLGSDAAEKGLVDEVGTEEEVEAWLETALDGPVGIRAFEPPGGFAARFRQGAASVAYAFGAGLASVLVEGRVDGSLPRIRT